MRHESKIKSDLSGKIKLSPAAACGDHELIQRTSLCVGYPSLHQSHCDAAPLVHTSSVPFTGGDCGGRDHHYVMLGTGTRSGGGCNVLCCSKFPLFRAIQPGEASEDAKD